MSYASYMDWILHLAQGVPAPAKKVLKNLLLESGAVWWRKTETVLSSMLCATLPHWFLAKEQN